jgi:hypothetical protein
MRGGGMVRFLCLLGVIVSLSLATQPALAIPAPMSDQELIDKSDLVALVRVLSVTCTNVTTDEQTGQELPSYLAKLQLLEVKKGDAKKGETVLVTWRAVPDHVAGPWAVYYYPGEEVLTHLAKRSSGASYASTWWNAKGDDVKSPDTRDLPTTPGETVNREVEPENKLPL